MLAKTAMVGSRWLPVRALLAIIGCEKYMQLLLRRLFPIALLVLANVQFELPSCLIWRLVMLCLTCIRPLGSCKVVKKLSGKPYTYHPVSELAEKNLCTDGFLKSSAEQIRCQK